MKFEIIGSRSSGGLQPPSREEIINELSHSRVLVVCPGYEYWADIALHFSSLGIPQANVINILDYLDHPDWPVSGDFIIVINNCISKTDESFHPASDDFPRLRCIPEIMEWFSRHKQKLLAIPGLQIDFFEKKVYERLIESDQVQKLRNLLLNFYENLSGNFFDEDGERVDGLTLA